MKRMCFTYHIHEVSDYINWDYFFHAWGFDSCFANIAQIHSCKICQNHWINSFESQEKRTQAGEAASLYHDAQAMLKKLDNGVYTTKALFRLCRANADGDDILVNDVRIPFLRQQNVKQTDEPNLCLSDFIRPLSTQIPDQIALFVTTVQEEMETDFMEDDYHHLLVQTLADRLAEATAEKMHEEVRKTHWGYAPQENFTPGQLHNELYQGIRPAIGYPALPDMSVNFLLDKLLDMNEIGVVLTENGAMKPHASVSGFMFAHPQSRYFAIGKISEQQLCDYARRRGLETEVMKKFLAKVLS